jgi:DNA-binding SARP family transcriptional activator
LNEIRRMTAPDSTQTRLRVLGPVNVDPPINGARRLAVLVYLVLARPRGLHSRDTLIGLLWPDADQAGGRHSLRNALHALRQALGADVIVTSGDTLVGVRPLGIDCDALALEADVAAGRYDDAIARYHGELLQGFYVSEAPEFERWVDSERRRLGELAQKAAWALAESQRAAGASEAAVDAARRASALAPDDEISLRRLLRFLDDGGDRVGALRTYDEFAERLETELDAEPSSETQAFVRSLREPRAAGELRAAAPAPRAPGTGVPIVPGEMVSRAPPISPSAVVLEPGRRSVRRPSAAVSLSAMALAVAATLALWPHEPSTRSAARLPIVVLPLINETADTALAYVAPALGESIADGLGMPVAIPYAATADLDLHDTNAVRRALRERGARVSVHGTVRGTADSLDLELRVASVDGGVLDFERFHGSEHQLALFRDSALAAIRAITRVPSQPAVRHVPDPEAFRMAKNAEYLLSRRTLPTLRKALDLYDQALDIDSDWPDLWLGRARVYGSLAYRHGMDYRDGMRRSEHDADEALARDSKDARAYMERAMARWSLGDVANAHKDALLAEALDSTDYHMQSLIGTWWQWTGDHLDSALFYTRRAERLAPWDRQIPLNIVEIVRCMPDSEQILRAADHVLETGTVPYALEVRAWTLTRLGRWNEAAETYEKRYPEYVRRGVTAAARKLAGESRFRETVRALRRAYYADSGAGRPNERLVEDRVSLFEDLGWRDSSIAALNAVVDSLEVHRTNMMCGENLRAFRRDPRVQEIVRRRGWTMGEYGREPK